MDREAWRAAIHGVAKSWTWLSDWTELNIWIFTKDINSKDRNNNKSWKYQLLAEDFSRDFTWSNSFNTTFVVETKITFMLQMKKVNEDQEGKWGTPVFIAALSITAGTWKQPRCPSADKWVRKLWYIYTMEYYSAIKKNSFESVLMRWMKLKPIIQSEVSQKEKHQYSILTLTYGI